MKTKYNFIGVAAVAAIAAFALSRVIWPDPIGVEGPAANLIPHFIFLSALESIAFGVGVAFLIFGYKHFRNLSPSTPHIATASFLSIAWMLTSWWPHDNMHRVLDHHNYVGLLKIEYIFHFTLILAAFVVARLFWKMMLREAIATP